MVVYLRLLGQMPDLFKTPAGNSALNRALCESKTPLPVREYFYVDAKNIHHLTPAEVSEWRGRTAVSESVKSAVKDLYSAKVMHGGKINQNSRIYPKSLLQENINRLKPLLAGGQLVGTSGHPGDEEYAGDPSRISKKWVDLTMAEDGSVTGTFSVVPTQVGKDLQIVLDEQLSALGFRATASDRPTHLLIPNEKCTALPKGRNAP